MQPGTTIAGRFRLDRQAGAGGMGTVWRATDLRTLRPVALKLVSSGDSSLSARFLREATLLASVRHPAIVGHVEHGIGEDGPFLAMEWLDGEDLGARLARGPIAPRLAIDLARRIADGLGVLHAAGIVHRDVKPANIMLVGGDAAGARLVDLGIARGRSASAPLTRTGAVLGTIGYMPTEQIEGWKDLDGRVDVYALGCVLFEALTGRPAYGGELSAMLARVFLDTPPRVRDVVPGLPASLDDLVARCMARDRRDRFEDVGALANALADVAQIAPELATASAQSGPRSARASFGGELRPAALVYASDPSLSSSETAAPSDEADLRAALEAIAARWGGTLHAAGGAALFVVARDAPPKDQAARAARIALDVVAKAPAWAVRVVASMVPAGTAPHLASLIRGVAPTLDGSGGAGRVELDAAIAGLLDARYVVDETDGAAVLHGLATIRDDARPLLGKPAPCVGREKELRLLEATLTECVDESAPRAVLLLADAGVGKSKIRREFVSRVEEGGQALVLRATADTDGRLSAFGLVRSLLEDAITARGEGPLHGSAAERWERARARFEPALARRSVDPIALELLGEILGAPPESPSPTLRAARTDPAEMRWQIRRALEEWLRGEAEARPVVLSVEDLHDADASSVGILAEVWAALDGSPVMLVGTARPDVETTHPALVSLRDLHVVRLGALGRKAAERLVREALGDAAIDAVAIVDRANGHPLLLEELIRHAAHGRSLAELPGSVLAVVQSRLLALPEEPRRVLRAASTFGERFPIDGVAALLGIDAPILQPSLDLLVREEILVGARRGQDDGEMTFRHALTRDAAYAMLLDLERVAGHRAAAEWLAGRERPDAPAIAEQLARGGDLESAARWFLVASRSAARSSGVEEAILLARRGRLLDVPLDLRMEILVEELLLRAFTGRFHDGLRMLESEVPWPELAVGSEAWLAAKMAWLCASAVVGRTDVFRTQLGDILRGARPIRACALRQHWTYLVALMLSTLGMVAEARAILRLSKDAADRAALPPTEEGYLAMAEAYIDWQVDSGRALGAYRRAILRLEAEGAFYLPLFRLAMILTELGRHSDADELTIRLKRRALRLHDRLEHSYALIGEALTACNGRPPRNAEHLVAELADTEDAVALASVRAFARASAWRAGRDERVADEVHRDLAAMDAALGRMPAVRAFVVLTLAEIDCERGRHAEALRRIDELGEPRVSLISTRTGLRYVRLVALAALGRDGEVDAALDEALARIERLEGEIDAEDRPWFGGAPFVRETREFAKRWKRRGT